LDADRRARAERRKGRVIAHVARSYEEAEAWDLAYWQARGPRARLSALVAIHRDISAIDPGHTVPRTRWTP
jgi:hypothetical protein